MVRQIYFIATHQSHTFVGLFHWQEPVHTRPEPTTGAQEEVHFTFDVIAERLSARLLILQSVFSVGGVWPQLPSRFRNAICHASGMQAKVWLVCKHWSV